MNATPAPEMTALDAAAQVLSALCYLAIGVAAWLHARRDRRTQVFLAFAAANVLAFASQAVGWQLGITNIVAMPRWLVAALLAALALSALLLFHFSQVFPRRRAWIKSSGVQMPVAYVLVPAAILGLALLAPKEVADLTPGYIAAAFVFGFPLAVLLSLVLPVTAIVSLVKSYKEAADSELARARVPIVLILVSQIAGGALALIFAPVLVTLAPGGGVVMALTVVMSLLTIVTPLAFALAVWKYEVLAIEPD